MYVESSGILLMPFLESLWEATQECRHISGNVCILIKTNKVQQTPQNLISEDFRVLWENLCRKQWGPLYSILPPLRRLLGSTDDLYEEACGSRGPERSFDYLRH